MDARDVVPGEFHADIPTSMRKADMISTAFRKLPLSICMCHVQG
jgi:hypothetical protein